MAFILSGILLFVVIAGLPTFLAIAIGVPIVLYILMLLWVFR